MYSSQGLSDWELMVVSGTLALGMLGISAMIGAFVAYLALREPATVPGKVVEAKTSKAMPVPVVALSDPVSVGRRVAVG